MQGATHLVLYIALLTEAAAALALRCGLQTAEVVQQMYRLSDECCQAADRSCAVTLRPAASLPQREEEDAVLIRALPGLARCDASPVAASAASAALQVARRLLRLRSDSAQDWDMSGIVSSARTLAPCSGAATLC